MTQQQPTIGRIVIFEFDAVRADAIQSTPNLEFERLGQSVVVPATIVQVFTEAMVNLKVHTDGPGPDLWETSVMIEELSPEGAARWRWPQRV